MKAVKFLMEVDRCFKKVRTFLMGLDRCFKKVLYTQENSVMELVFSAYVRSENVDEIPVERI